jgi:hypothetical protein
LQILSNSIKCSRLQVSKVLIFLHKEIAKEMKGIFLSQILFVVREWQWYLKHKMHKKISFTPFADCDQNQCKLYQKFRKKARKRAFLKQQWVARRDNNGHTKSNN